VFPHTRRWWTRCNGLPETSRYQSPRAHPADLPWRRAVVVALPAHKFAGTYQAGGTEAPGRVGHDLVLVNQHNLGFHSRIPLCNASQKPAVDRGRLSDGYSRHPCRVVEVHSQIGAAGAAGPARCCCPLLMTVSREGVRGGGGGPRRGGRKSKIGGGKDSG
jgi:hypothetical protein